jgi:hypothetical protein
LPDAATTHEPTVVMAPPLPPAPLPLPEVVTAAASAPAPRSALLPQRSSMLVLAGLVALNVLAWWWFTRGDAPHSDARASALAPALAAPARAASAPAPAAAMTTAPVPSAEPAETILSVLPARAPRPSAAAASAPLAATAASAATARMLEPPPLPRAPALDSAATPRVADTAANRGPRPAVADPIDPRARCGERSFLSMLVCIKRQCTEPAVAAHAECVRLREQEGAPTRDSDR